jgi:hypothetical protein
MKRNQGKKSHFLESSMPWVLLEMLKQFSFGGKFSRATLTPNDIFSNRNRFLKQEAK